MTTDNASPTSQPPEGYEYCADVLLSALHSSDGIVSAEIDGKAGQLRLGYDSDRISEESIESLATVVGTRLDSQLTRCGRLVENSDCQAGARALEACLAEAGHASEIAVSGVPSTFRVASKTLDLPGSRIAQWVRDLTLVASQPKRTEEVQTTGRIMAILTGLALLFLAGGWLAGYLGAPAHIEISLFVLAYATGGYFGTREGLQALRKRSLDVNILMVVAALGAASIGDWVEGGLLLFLFSLSSTLEEYAMGRTQNAIRSLMDLRPDEATIIRNG